MKLGKLTTIVATTLLTFGMATPVMAADSANSPATVSFTDTGSITTPLDPNDASTILEGDGTTNHSGTLTIDYVSKLDFGTANTSNTDSQTLPAKTDTVKIGTDKTSAKRSNFVQVTDKRGGSLGWELTVKQSVPFTREGDSHELVGSEIKFNERALVSTIEGQAPSMGDGDSVSVFANDSDVQLLDAPAGKGAGTTIHRFGEAITNNTIETTNGVQLVVPAGSARAGTYNGTLTWSLTDTPSRSE